MPNGNLTPGQERDKRILITIVTDIRKQLAFIVLDRRGLFQGRVPPVLPRTVAGN